LIRKILIANRGEIAVRIARACAEMGIKSVAIFTDADRYSLHTTKADENYNIGPDSVAGYLNVSRIVDLAVAAGCDAIHPGYGFLSENPALAEKCRERRIRFIGPGPDIIRLMGDKLQARKVAIAERGPRPGEKNRLPGDAEGHQWRRRTRHPPVPR
jgi:pyruvate carboxylase subunit A